MGTNRSRLFKSVAGAAVAAMLLAACGGGGGDKADGGDKGNGVVDEKADKGLPVVGENVTYDPNTLVNDGQPISMDWWMWGDTKLWQPIIDSYTEIHPNVTINLVPQPWDDYWTKLPLELQGSSGPTIFNIHNSHHDNLINFLEPYDIATEDLEADFVGAATHVIDDKIYYIDFGLMTGAIYYNVDMWEKAGLTDADIPETWDEFREVAKKLTIRDGDSLVQAGFNMNESAHHLQLGVPYQFGQNLMAEDQVTPTVNTDIDLEVMNMLLGIYEDGSGDPNFGPKSGDSFGQGQSAMVYAWGHFANTLNNDFPNIKYKTFPTPIPEKGEVPYGYDRYNGESTIGINKSASPEQKALAQDFLRFFLTDIDSQKNLTLNMGVYPSYRLLDGDPAYADMPAQSAVVDINHYIWPGPMPATFENSLKRANDDVMYNGVEPKAALDTAQESIERDLQGANFKSVEDLYPFYKAN